MKNKEGKDVAVEALTADNYLVPKGEEKLYHCVIEVVQYDPKTGKKLSRPRVQKFGKKAFENLIFKTLKKQGYTVTILHNPTGWAEVAAKQKAEAEKAKFDAAVAASVEAVLAKQKEADKEAADKAKADADAKDAEIAKLKAELAKAKKEAKKTSKEAAKPEAGE